MFDDVKSLLGTIAILATVFVLLGLLTYGFFAALGIAKRAQDAEQEEEKKVEELEEEEKKK